jgi:hypothetical protein
MHSSAEWMQEPTIGDWILERAQFLIEVSHDAPRLGISGGAARMRWNSGERAEVRAELVAAFFHLYGIERPDVDYILDTFPILRRKDEQTFGEYRIKRRILEIYDAMAEAAAAGAPYTSVLPDRASAQDEHGS